MGPHAAATCEQGAKAELWAEVLKTGECVRDEGQTFPFFPKVFYVICKKLIKSSRLIGDSHSLHLGVKLKSL